MGTSCSVGGSATSGEGLTCAEVASALKMVAASILEANKDEHERQGEETVPPIEQTAIGSNNSVSNNYNYQCEITNSTNINKHAIRHTVSTNKPSNSHTSCNGTNHCEDNCIQSNPLNQIVLETPRVSANLELNNATLERNLSESTRCVNRCDVTNYDIIREAESLANLSYSECVIRETRLVETIKGKRVENQVKVTEYAPKVFRFIRKVSCVDDYFFANEWCLDESEMCLELGEGRSQALFLKSKNMAFMCKTIAKDEVDILIRILQKYVAHISQYPNSLLMRFYMLLKLEVGKCFGYILCAADVYSGARKINEKWDIKGRTPKPGKFHFYPHLLRAADEPDPYLINTPVTWESLSSGDDNQPINNCESQLNTSSNTNNNITTSANRSIRPNGAGTYTVRRKRGVPTKHDKDLTRLFWLDKAVRERLVAQLTADYCFLSNVKLMDYSLLVGVSYNESKQSRSGQSYTKLYNVVIHSRSNMIDAVEVRPSVTRPTRDRYQALSEFAEGVHSLYEQEEYYIGVIDVLTHYSWKKKSANFFKSILWKEETLSTIPPKAYCDRITRFTQIIFP